MKKIAIIGANNKDRLVLTRALYYLTGYDIVNKTDYTVQAIRYGLNKELRNCKWQELFVYLLSSFSERIVIEQHYDQYISDGSVFYELAMVKAILNLQTTNKRKLKEEITMLTGTERIITEYANRHYDCFVYIDSATNKANELSNEIDNCIKSLIIQHGSIYQVKKDSILSDILEKITTETQIQPIVSSEMALKKAQEDILK